MKFWDASAIIPLCIEEPMSNPVRKLAEEDDGLVVWWGTQVECWSAFARLRREGVLDIQEEARVRQLLGALCEAWMEIIPGGEVRNIAGRLLMTHPLRAADAMQLAAALLWANKSPNGHHFACLDARLGEAARQEGFMVLPLTS